MFSVCVAASSLSAIDVTKVRQAISTAKNKKTDLLKNCCVANLSKKDKF